MVHTLPIRDRWTRMSAACPPRVRVRDFSKNSCPCPRPCPRSWFFRCPCPCPRPCPRTRVDTVVRGHGCPCPPISATNISSLLTTHINIRHQHQCGPTFIMLGKSSLNSPRAKEIFSIFQNVDDLIQVLFRRDRYVLQNKNKWLRTSNYGLSSRVN